MLLFLAAVLKFFLAKSSTTELSSAKLANSFARTYTQSVLRVQTLKAPFYSCQEQSTSSTQFPSLKYSLNILLLSSLVFNFSILWRVSLDPAFPMYSSSSLWKGLINSADTFTNPADIHTSLFSLETKDALVGSVTRLEGLSVTQGDKNSSSTIIFSFWKEISITGKNFSTLCLTNALSVDFPIVNATLEIVADLPGFDSIQSLRQVL